MDFPYTKTKQALENALEEKQGSAMAIYVKKGEGKGEREGKRKEEEYTDYLGYHCHEGLGVRNKVNSESLFDLASLTKILVSFPLFLMAKEERLLDFQDPIKSHFPQFPREDISLIDLLEHKTGLPPTIPFFLQKKHPGFGKASVLEEICQIDIPTNKKHPTQYSDLNFLLIGFLLEELYKKPLHLIFEEKIQKKLSLKYTNFVVEDPTKKEEKSKGCYVATARCENRKKVLQGEVDDTNCWALKGSAGHAGLFSNLKETALLFEHSLKLAKKHKELGFPHKASLPPFTTAFMLYPGITKPIDSSWKNAIGHVGFVGTSAWYHSEKKYTAILLSNSRVHPERFQDRRWIQTRLKVHSFLWEELEASR